MSEIQSLPKEFVSECQPLLSINTEANRVELKKQDSIFLYFSTFTVGLILVTVGSFVVWISPVLPKLQSNDTNVNPLGSPITTFQTSTLAAMLSLGNTLSPWLIKLLLDSQGRKRTLMLLSTSAYFAAAIIAFSGNFYAYCIARCIGGLSLGASFIAAPIYISEITDEHNRGKMGVLMSLFNPLGNLYGYVIGPIFSVQTFTLLCALPVFISFIIVGLLLPDSPVYLASIGQDAKALKAIRKLGHKTSRLNAESDLVNISKRLKDCHIENQGFLSLLQDNHFRRGFIIVLGVKLTWAFSGFTVISGFIGPIFNDARDGITGDNIGICMGLIQIITLIITSFVTEKLGRRMLLLYSTLGTFVCLSFVGVYFYLKSINFKYLESIAWLPVLSIITFYITYSLGLGCVPRLLLSEIFPNNVRSTAVTVVSFISSIVLVFMTFAFPILQKAFGTAFCFGTYAISCFIGFWFVYFIVPETKGRNIIEVSTNNNGQNHC